MKEKIQIWAKKYCRLSQEQMLSAIILFAIMSFIEENMNRILIYLIFIYSFGHYLTYKIIEFYYLNKGECVNFIGYLKFNRLASFGIVIFLFLMIDEHAFVKFIYLSYYVFYHMIKPNFLLKEFESFNFKYEELNHD